MSAMLNLSAPLTLVMWWDFWNLMESPVGIASVYFHPYFKLL